MRRAMLLAVGLLAGCAAFSHTGAAQGRDLPGALIGAFTRPLDSVLSGGRRYNRHRQYRHRSVSRKRHRSVVTAPAPDTATVQTDAPAAAPAALPNAVAGDAVANPPMPLPRPATAAAASMNPAVSRLTRGRASSEPRSEPKIERAGEATSEKSDAASARGAATLAPAAALPAKLDEPTAKANPAVQNTALALPDAPAQSATASAAAAGEDAKPSREAMPLGVVGPLAWPTAYQDVIGFTLWPQRYGQRLHVHGIVDVLTAMFEPKAASGLRLARATEPTGSVGASICGGEVTDWPAAEIAGSMSLTSSQQAVLDQLKSKIAEAARNVKASCTDTSAMSPVERLQAMEKVLWAVRDATNLIRAPLANFYDALSEQQRSQFITVAPNARAGRGTAAGMCGMSKLDAPMRQAERSLHPSGAQRASFDNLQKKSFEMGQFLLASCLQPIPSTPTARLDTAVNRLTAVIFATSHISLALNDFYNQLSPEQKVKFDSFGR